MVSSVPFPFTVTEDSPYFPAFSSAADRAS